MKEKIFESLNNALDNGYNNVLYNSAQEVADDLKEYDAQFENIEVDDNFISIVLEWQKQTKESLLK